MASIDFEQQQEQARMQAERAAEGRNPNEDTQQYGNAPSFQDYGTSSSNMLPSDPGDGGGGGNGGGPDSPGGPGGGGGGGGTDRAARQAQFEALKKQYPFLAQDPGNLESFLSGRNDLAGFTKDTVARAAPTGSRLLDSQGGNYNNDGTLTPKGIAALAAAGIGPTGTRITPPAGTPGTGTPGPSSYGNDTRSYPAFQNTSPMFSDPASRLIEDYALDRFGRLINPDPNSGTGLYESYLRELVNGLKGPDALEQYLPELIATLKQPGALERYLPQLVDELKQPVYSDQQTSQLKAQVYDGIEKERSATKSRWLQEISRRRFAPSSGPALEGLLRIDEQFNTARTVADQQFAVGAIGLTENRRSQILDAMTRLQGATDARTGQTTDAITALAGATKSRQGRTVDTLGSLAGSEEDRQAKALTYATLPKQLSDNAFQQGLQLVGAGGNPSSMLSSALSIYNAVAQNKQMDQARRNASLESIFQYIAGLFG